MTWDPRSDEALLAVAREQPEAFGVFYRRHARPLAAFFLRRMRDPEQTADLTAETFAAALDGCDRFDPARGPAIAWLYGIAHRRLSQAWRRGGVEDRARGRLGMERLELDDEALARIEALADLEGPQAARLPEALDELPADQRDAVRARVLDEREYGDIAMETGSSEPAVDRARRRSADRRAARRSRRSRRARHCHPHDPGAAVGAERASTHHRHHDRQSAPPLSRRLGARGAAPRPAPGDGAFCNASRADDSPEAPPSRSAQAAPGGR